MIFSNKSQMIHVISEVVVLIGFTFYFTSKINKLSKELLDTIEIVKIQNNKILSLEKMIQALSIQVTNISKSNNKLQMQNTQPQVTQPQVTQPQVTQPQVTQVHDNISDKTYRNLEKIQELSDEDDTFEDTDEQILENSIQELNEEDLDKELEDELNELKLEEE
jgi:hypothetical protein